MFTLNAENCNKTWNIENITYFPFHVFPSARINVFNVISQFFTFYANGRLALEEIDATAFRLNRIGTRYFQ